MKSTLSVASLFIVVAVLGFASLAPGVEAQTHMSISSKLGGASAIQISWPAMPKDIVNLSGSVSMNPSGPSSQQLVLDVPSDRHFILRNFDVVDFFNLCDCYTAPTGTLVEELPDGTQVTKHSFVIGHNSSYGSTVGIVFSPGSKVIFTVNSSTASGGYIQNSIPRWNVSGFFAKD